MSEFEQSLPELFTKAQQLFTRVVEQSECVSEGVVEEAISAVDSALTAVSREAVFSVNEELEEIPTSSVRFLYLRYYLGVLHARVMHRGSERVRALRSAELHLNEYLETCARLQVLHEDERKAMDGSQAVSE
jgi:chorismate mutase